jgi:hypothetical protein
MWFNAHVITGEMDRRGLVRLGGIICVMGFFLVLFVSSTLGLSFAASNSVEDGQHGNSYGTRQAYIAARSAALAQPQVLQGAALCGALTLVLFVAATWLAARFNLTTSGSFMFMLCTGLVGGLYIEWVLLPGLRACTTGLRGNDEECHDLIQQSKSRLVVTAIITVALPVVYWLWVISCGGL